MAKTDVPVKRLVQLRTKDWIKLATGSNEELSYLEMKTERNPKLESRLDNLYKVETNREEFILNIEPQGYADKSISARMLRYRADICESLISTDKKTLPIKQVVIYFSKDNEVTENTLLDDLFENSRINYSYDVIRVWELDKKEILDNKLYGLYPLLPLMKDERKKHNREEVFKESVQIVLGIEDEALRADILTGMTFLAEVEYTKEIILKYIRRELLMMSELWKEWSAEERKEALEKGLEEGMRIEKLNTAIKLLTKRFGPLTTEMKARIKKLDTMTLEVITDSIFEFQSLDDVKKYL